MRIEKARAYENQREEKKLNQRSPSWSGGEAKDWRQMIGSKEEKEGDGESENGLIPCKFISFAHNWACIWFSLGGGRKKKSGSFSKGEEEEEGSVGKDLMNLARTLTLSFKNLDSFWFLKGVEKRSSQCLLATAAVLGDGGGGRKAQKTCEIKLMGHAHKRQWNGNLKLRNFFLETFFSHSSWCDMLQEPIQQRSQHATHSLPLSLINSIYPRRSNTHSNIIPSCVINICVHWWWWEEGKREVPFHFSPPPKFKPPGNAERNDGIVQPHTHATQSSFNGI